MSVEENVYDVRNYSTEDLQALAQLAVDDIQVPVRLVRWYISVAPTYTRIIIVYRYVQDCHGTDEMNTYITL